MIIAAFLLAVVSTAPATSGAPFTPTAAQVEAAGKAQSIGRLLYEYDQVAWVSTDALLAKVPDPGSLGVRGYIVDPVDGGYDAIYFGQRGSEVRKIFVARVSDRKVVSSRVLAPEEDASLSPSQLRMIRARQAVLNEAVLRKAKVQRCTPGMPNTVVFPPTESGEVPVYFLAAQGSSTSYPFGGHYRFTVAPDGRVASDRAFAKSCLAMEREKTVTAFTITHFLDPQPTEIHVWQSLASGVPLLVVMVGSGEVWSVEGDRIEPGIKLPHDK